MTLDDKLAALRHCATRGYFEDLAGHLCDLLEHCRQNIHPDVGPPFADLAALVGHYGKDPRGIDPPPETVP